MRAPRFSLRTLLLTTTIVGMTVCIFLQNAALRDKDARYAAVTAELGMIDAKSSRQIHIRALSLDGINHWRFRVQKPEGDFEYCFGVVDVDDQGQVGLPARRRRYFQCVESTAGGEGEIVFSMERDGRGYCFMKFYEFHAKDGRVATALRMDGMPAEMLSTVWRIDGLQVQNDLPALAADPARHGDVTRHDSNATILLFRSEAPNQEPGKRRAFVIGLRRKPAPEASQSAPATAK